MGEVRAANNVIDKKSGLTQLSFMGGMIFILFIFLIGKLCSLDCCSNITTIDGH